MIRGMGERFEFDMTTAHEALQSLPSASDRLFDLARRTISDRDNFFEDAIAGLVAAGVPLKDLELVTYRADSGRMTLLVRGIPRYEYTIKSNISPDFRWGVM